MWSSDDNLFLLEGEPGVGKTTVSHKIIKASLQLNKRCLISAPTHKALSVLESKLLNLKNKVGFSTVQSFLDYKKTYDFNKGIAIFKSPHFDRMKVELANKFDLIFIDECSMLTADMYAKLKVLTSINKDLKIILCGDRKQLNPVDEPINPLFHQLTPFKLTEIVRQAEGNPILDLVRNHTEILSFRQNNLTDEKKGYAFFVKEDVLDSFITLLAQRDDMVYLAYSNKACDNVNSAVRTKKYGDAAPTLVVGESIIMKHSKDFKTGEIRVITKITPDLTLNLNDVGMSISYMRVFFDNGLNCAIPTNKQELDNLITEVAKLAKSKKIHWVRYFEIAEYFQEYTYKYAITTHSSQGSTYFSTIIDLRDMMINRDKEERTRLLYTAVSRASDLCVILY